MKLDLVICYSVSIVWIIVCNFNWFSFFVKKFRRRLLIQDTNIINVSYEGFFNKRFHFEYLFHCKEKGMLFTIEKDISQMVLTATVTAPYPFHDKLSHFWLYVLDNLTNSIFKVLNRTWSIGIELVFCVTSKKKV